VSVLILNKNRTREINFANTHDTTLLREGDIHTVNKAILEKKFILERKKFKPHDDDDGTGGKMRRTEEFNNRVRKRIETFP